MWVCCSGGAKFQKHVDNTAKDGRVLTVLCYLNPQWDATLGGALRLHTPSGPVDMCPAGGRIAMFWADQMPHEVSVVWRVFVPW